MKAQRIFERELNACFQTFYGYAFATFVLLTAGIYTVLSCLKGGSADFTQVPRSMTFTLLLSTMVWTAPRVIMSSLLFGTSSMSGMRRTPARRSVP